MLQKPSVAQLGPLFEGDAMCKCDSVWILDLWCRWWPQHETHRPSPQIIKPSISKPLILFTPFKCSLAWTDAWLLIVSAHCRRLPLPAAVPEEVHVALRHQQQPDVLVRWVACQPLPPPSTGHCRNLLLFSIHFFFFCACFCLPVSGVTAVAASLPPKLKDSIYM